MRLTASLGLSLSLLLGLVSWSTPTSQREVVDSVIDDGIVVDKAGTSADKRGEAGRMAEKGSDGRGLTSDSSSMKIWAVPRFTRQYAHLPIAVWQKTYASWYGPGFYGNRTACGQRYSPTILGVAHKALPCGTKVAFKHLGRTVVARVIDRGPYVRGRTWDLSAALCQALRHCYTGPIFSKVVR